MEFHEPGRVSFWLHLHFAICADGPGFDRRDASNNQRVVLSYSDSTREWTLSLRDANEKTQDELTVLADKPFGPLLRLDDATNDRGCSVSQVGPGIGLLDANGKPETLLLGAKHGPWLVMYDSQGRELLSKQ